MEMWKKYDLNGKKVLINGGSSGLGKEIAGFLVDKGCYSIITSSNREKLEKTFEELKHENLKYFICDVTNYYQLKDLSSFLEKDVKRIDALINCAAILGPVGKFQDNDFEKWKKTIDINLTGNAYLIHELIPYLLKSKNPKVINFSGGGAAYPRPYHTAYAASKAAMVNLTQNLADEYKGKIDFNIIAPGAHKTNMWKEETHDKEPEKWADINRLFGWISFLISSKSDGITGRFFHVNNDWENLTKEISETDRFQLRRTD